MSTPLTIDIVSDVVCPWCYVGKRRLERALALRPGVKTEVRWLPFFLDARVPKGGMARIDYIRNKFGGDEKITPGHKRLAALGGDLGIDFHFEKIEKQPNTTDAHRVIGWAQEAGKADPVVDRLFELFFTEGADLTDREVIVGAAKAGGLDGEAVRRDLAGGRDAELIEKQATAASMSGIGGVPYFVFNKKVALAGAHEPEVIAGAIDQALAEKAQK